MPGEFDAWQILWDGYNAFYGRHGPSALPAEITRTTWQRFFDAYEPVHCLVGARSLVTEGKSFAEGSLIMGAPAVVVRALSAEQIAGVRQSAAHYVANAKRFRAGLQKIG